MEWFTGTAGTENRLAYAIALLEYLYCKFTPHVFTCSVSAMTYYLVLLTTQKIFL
jgi:hypothetical protein